MERIIGIKASDRDNVATIFRDVKKGDLITVLDKSGKEESIISSDDIPYGHKIAVCDINTGDNIVKYGESIGGASSDIKKGDYVHLHNLESLRGRGDLAGEKRI
ncbi:MAG: UxaA family hydrolase [Ruminococcaceae bacterium]|nr:UxaA family hydrolase [Oscillospiraceae bacterium]